MKIDGGEYIFSSGRTIFARDGIVGISPDLGIYGGYDDWHGDIPNITKTSEDQADMLELADYMIERWKKFRETVLAKKGG